MDLLETTRYTEFNQGKRFYAFPAGRFVYIFIVQKSPLSGIPTDMCLFFMLLK